MFRSLQSSVGSYQELQRAIGALFDGYMQFFQFGTSGIHLAFVMDRIEC